jgi:CO/xanthine dehydrogenase FAD-binding subunit
MRAYLPTYELKKPVDLAGALRLLADEPGVWKPFAGGTDLMVLFEAGRLAHRKYVNIWNLAELRGISITEEYIALGALTTYTDVQASGVLQKEFPMLCQAASETGGLAIQNRGTLGGNIANASPAGDSPPALLVYDAQLELVSTQGSRFIPYNGFHTGYKEMLIRPDELIKSIRLPRTRQPWQHYYRKVGTRKAQAISKICFAGVAQMDGGLIKDIRIALGSVAPTVVRCSRTEDVLRNQKVNVNTIGAARTKLASEISPISDIRSTSHYRLQVALNVLEDFLVKL